jgi:hypothetical protein
MEMASLKFYIEKFGKTQGRKEYNAYHRQYRKHNQERMRKYWRDFHALQKASKQAVSSGL